MASEKFFWEKQIFLKGLVLVSEERPPESREIYLWFPEAEGLFINAHNFEPRFSEDPPAIILQNIVLVSFSEVAQLYCQAKGHSGRIEHDHGCGTVDNPAMAVWRNTGLMTG